MHSHRRLNEDARPELGGGWTGIGERDSRAGACYLTGIVRQSAAGVKFDERGKRGRPAAELAAGVDL